jgi:hypothetical protein
MLIRISAGAGFDTFNLDTKVFNNIGARYSEGFISRYDTVFDPAGDSMIKGFDSYHIKNMNQHAKIRTATITYQGRLDFDWELGGGFLFAAGAGERYSQWNAKQETGGYKEIAAKLPYNPSSPGTEDGYISIPVSFNKDVQNRGFNTSAHTLLEYASPRRRLVLEGGIRVDHFYLRGRGFSLYTRPAFNPRFNVDIGILENKGILDKLTLSLGTGLFSSMNNMFSHIDRSEGVENSSFRDNRSWTSVSGLRMDFSGGYSVHLEGYYKYVFNRAYASEYYTGNERHFQYEFDGQGMVWGFDVMLQKLESAYWDGWISYSFNYALYRDPHSGLDKTAGSVGAYYTDWYFPDFHRFHYLNLVLNIKPTKQFNIALRFGFASGVPLEETGTIESYPVELVDSQDPANDKTIIEKWKRSSGYSGTRRTSFSLPLDVKFSLYRFNPQGKVQSEIYLSVENILSLFYTPRGNTKFNSYTGKEDRGSDSVSYEMTFPMVSFGFKWSY